MESQQSTTLKRAFSRTPPFWHPDLELPASTTMRNKLLLFVSPGGGRRPGPGPGRLYFFLSATLRSVWPLSPLTKVPRPPFLARRAGLGAGGGGNCSPGLGPGWGQRAGLVMARGWGVGAPGRRRWGPPAPLTVGVGRVVVEDAAGSPAVAAQHNEVALVVGGAAEAAGPAGREAAVLGGAGAEVAAQHARVHQHDGHVALRQVGLDVLHAHPAAGRTGSAAPLGPPPGPSPFLTLTLTPAGLRPAPCPRARAAPSVRPELHAGGAHLLRHGGRGSAGDQAWTGGAQDTLGPQALHRVTVQLQTCPPLPWSFTLKAALVT